MVKVLQIHTQYRQPGGEDVVVRVEADVLRAAGHEVVEHHVTNPEQPLPAAATLASAPWNAAAARRVGAVAARVRPDVAHVHNTWFALSPSILSALREAAVPVVMTLHNYRLTCSNGILFRDGGPCQDCVGSHPWHGVRHRCYRDSALLSAFAAGTIAVNARRQTWSRDVDLHVALTSFAHDVFIKAGVPSSKIVVKPNIVLDPGPRRDRPSSSPFVLYVGRLAQEKGVHELLAAWAVKPRRPLELLVVGDGPLRRELEDAAGEGVRFLGSVDPAEVRRLMGSARTLVFPSLCYETFGLVVVEAMAAGLPVVASRLGGVGELIGEDAGWLAPAGSVADWSHALDRLTDDVLVDQAGSAARRRYDSTFSASAGLRRLERVYERAIESFDDSVRC